MSTLGVGPLEEEEDEIVQLVDDEFETHFKNLKLPEDDYMYDSAPFQFDGDEPLAPNQVIDDECVINQEPIHLKPLDKYVIGGELGSGSYATVKEALNTENLARRAVKIIKSKKIKKIKGGDKNVANELKIHLSLNHPNIIKLYEIIRNEVKEKIYMFLEYCPSVLQELLESAPQKKLPEWQSHYFYSQLIHGVDYLHSIGVIHRDLKPGNLLISNSYQLKIADFGVATRLGLFEPDLIEANPGCYLFQPPEAVSGDEDQYSGTKNDIWSTGIILYNLVTGTFPFMGNNIYNLCLEIGKGEYDVPDFLDHHLVKLIQIILVKDWRKRADIEKIKSHDWFRRRHLATEPPVPIPPSKILGDEAHSMTTLFGLLNFDPGAMSDPILCYEDTGGTTRTIVSSSTRLTGNDHFSFNSRNPCAAGDAMDVAINRTRIEPSSARLRSHAQRISQPSNALLCGLGGCSNSGARPETASADTAIPPHPTTGNGQTTSSTGVIPTGRTTARKLPSKSSCTIS